MYKNMKNKMVYFLKLQNKHTKTNISISRNFFYKKNVSHLACGFVENGIRVNSYQLSDFLSL